MRKTDHVAAGMAAAALTLAASGAAQAACAGAGVITRIQGQPQDVVLMRDGAAVSRPRVLEVLCEGDTLQMQGASVATLSMDGVGPVKVTAGKPYLVAKHRAGPTVASNAYFSLSSHVLKDMKRQPWDVRLRGPGPALSFAVGSLGGNQEKLLAGRRDVLVRMSGGVGSYRVTLSDAKGAMLSEGQGGSSDVVLKGLNLTPGDYVLKGADGAGATVSAKVQVVQAALPVAPDLGVEDPEVRAALVATELARTAAPVWSFESEQVLNAAPIATLDRDAIYRLIESYGDAEPE